MYDRGGERVGDGGPIVVPGEGVFFSVASKRTNGRKKKLLKYLRRVVRVLYHSVIIGSPLQSA